MVHFGLGTMDTLFLLHSLKNYLLLQLYKMTVAGLQCHILVGSQIYAIKITLCLDVQPFVPFTTLGNFSGIELFVTCGKRITDTRIKVEGKS